MRKSTEDLNGRAGNGIAFRSISLSLAVTLGAGGILLPFQKAEAKILQVKFSSISIRFRKKALLE